MPEANNLRYCRISINKQPDKVSGLCGFPLLSYSPKCLREIYRAQYGDAIFVPFRGAQIWRLETKANICCLVSLRKWLVTHCKLANIHLNTFSNASTAQGRKCHTIKAFFYIRDSFLGRHFNVARRQITKLFLALFWKRITPSRWKLAKMLVLKRSSACRG